MTHYQRLARRHWERYAPTRVTELEDPEEFFLSLGQQVHEQVTALAATLAGPEPAGEGYWDKTGRLTAARMQAEEVVLTDLVWITQPETTPAEDRESWELDRTPDSWLASWAERIQDSPSDQTPSDEELAELAAQWAVPVIFLRALLSVPSPHEYLHRHEDLLARAADRRYRS